MSSRIKSSPFGMIRGAESLSMYTIDSCVFLRSASDINLVTFYLIAITKDPITTVHLIGERRYGTNPKVFGPIDLYEFLFPINLQFECRKIVLTKHARIEES